MPNNIAGSEILLEFISTLLTNIIDIDVLSILQTQATEDITPFLYSIMTVWCEGKSVLIEESIIYEYENKLSEIFKDLCNDDSPSLFLEYFRMIFVNELDDLSIYLDLSEKLSLITLFAYACFPKQKYMSHIHSDIEMYCPGDDEELIEINQKVWKVLGESVIMNQQSKPIFHNAQTTLMDHPDKVSLITYTRKCNWQCFGCYNMRELLKDDFVTPFTTDEIIKLVESPIVDLLIISGGESLLLKDELVNEISYIRSKTNKPIRIDTNGTQYETAKKLVDLKLVDGFAVDVKFPYWLSTTAMLYNIVGVDIVDTESILKTMKLADGMPYSIFRTVKYPILPDSIVEQITEYMKQNFKSLHQVNKFYTMA